MFKNWYDIESAITCVFYKLNSENSQDQSTCPNIFVQNALNSSFRTFRWQHFVNDIRKYSNSSHFLVFPFSFLQLAQSEFVFWKFLFSIKGSGEGWEWFDDLSHLKTIIIFFKKVKRKTKTPKSLFLEKDGNSFKLCLA